MESKQYRPVRPIASMRLRKSPREGHAKVTDMTAVQQHLVGKTKGSHWARVIVLTAVVAVGLISAPTVLAASPLLSAPRHEAVTNARASEAPVMPQSLASRACAGTPASTHEREGRVAEATRMLDRPRLKGTSQAQREKHVEFVVGNLLFVLGHEAGHAVIREMGVPVVGREEDAADFFSTLTALTCDEGFGDRVLANAALGWFLSDRRDRRDRRDQRGVQLSIARTRATSSSRPLLLAL